MLGQPISMVLPEVVGYKLHGTPEKLITSTDIVLTVTKVITIVPCSSSNMLATSMSYHWYHNLSPLPCTQHLRQVGVVGKFVEFFGPGVLQLSIADRATIANMCPEYGATAAFFPVDDVSIQYLAQTGECETFSVQHHI